MTYTRIENTQHPLFAGAWRLYLASFPPEERRRLTSQKKIMGNPLYHFEVIRNERGLFVGFIMWWEFDDVRYIEHFAILPRLRGEGYGRCVLTEFIFRSRAAILLEVEPPVGETSRRRIDFYERIGFVLNEHEYRQPPYRKGGESVPLMLMTYPAAITTREVCHFREHCHPVVFGYDSEK